MGKLKNQPNSISLSFGLESSASLWNIVFKGFDEEVVLISRFEGMDPATVALLHRFGSIVGKKYMDCSVELIGRGLAIKKTLPTNDLSVMRNWTELMQNVREEMLDFIEELTG